MLRTRWIEFPEKSARDLRFRSFSSEYRIFTGLYCKQSRLQSSWNLLAASARMQFSGLRKEFEVNSDMQHWCVDVARWFHRHGVVWSGTPSELAAELSSAGVVDEQLRALDANRLVAELEANAEGLQAAGVDVSVQRARERVRSISLRANGRETPIGREEEQPARVDGNRELYVVPI